MYHDDTLLRVTVSYDEYFIALSWWWLVSRWCVHGDIDNRLALQTTNPILTNTCHWLIKMLERLKIVLYNSNLIIHWAINKVFDLMDVLKYFLCIFQLLLFYVFIVLLNVNSSPSDISLNSSHQAAYCIIISTQNWSCGDSCRILKVIFSEKLDEVIAASSLCTAMFWETQQRRPFQLCHERKVWGWSLTSRGGTEF